MVIFERLALRAILIATMMFVSRNKPEMWSWVSIIILTLTWMDITIMQTFNRSREKNEYSI